MQHIPGLRRFPQVARQPLPSPWRHGSEQARASIASLLGLTEQVWTSQGYVRPLGWLLDELADTYAVRQLVVYAGMDELPEGAIDPAEVETLLWGGTRRALRATRGRRVVELRGPEARWYVSADHTPGGWSRLLRHGVHGTLDLQQPIIGPLRNFGKQEDLLAKKADPTPSTLRGIGEQWFIGPDAPGQTHASSMSGQAGLRPLAQLLLMREPGQPWKLRAGFRNRRVVLEAPLGELASPVSSVLALLWLIHGMIAREERRGWLTARAEEALQAVLMAEDRDSAIAVLQALADRILLKGPRLPAGTVVVTAGTEHRAPARLVDVLQHGEPAVPGLAQSLPIGSLAAVLSDPEDDGPLEVVMIEGPDDAPFIKVRSVADGSLAAYQRHDLVPLREPRLA